MFVKFCGFTRECDVEAALECGVDAVGFVFYEKSSRFVSFQNARKLIACLAGTNTKAVGVFVDEGADDIIEKVASLNLNVAQIYSHEIMHRIHAVVPVLMTYRIQNADDIARVIFPTDGYVLLDSYTRSGYGGTGMTFDWKLLRDIPLNRAIVSGGLSPRNVGELIRTIRPFGVDVSSGIEESPGIKSVGKMRAFMKQVKEAVDCEKVAEC